MDIQLKDLNNNELYPVTQAKTVKINNSEISSSNNLENVLLEFKTNISELSKQLDGVNVQELISTNNGIVDLLV